MDRSRLNKYKKPEEKLILSKILDKISFCETRNQIQVSDFLDLAQQELIRKFLQNQKYQNYLFYGGWEEAERKVLVCYPEKLTMLMKEQRINYNEWIKVIRITLPNENKGTYEHRNYLSALMKLGMKREKIGDILVDEDGADILVHKDMLKFLQSNLSELTRFQKANIEEVELKHLKKITIEKKEMTITVSSMRLDNIVAELAKCSRSKANELLMQERVFVNFEAIAKPTKEIKIGDRITIRGKGRFQVEEILGTTKKGNTLLQISCFSRRGMIK